MTNTLSAAMGMSQHELQQKPLIEGDSQTSIALRGWVENSLLPSENYQRRYFPPINALNQAKPGWHQTAEGFNRGIELIEIIFQDGANGASYQRIDGGDTVWSADSAVAAWGHYGLPVATQRVAPNKQVSWAGSGRLDPRKLQQALGQAFDSPSSFQDSLQKAPSKTLAEASLLSDGEAGPDGQASSLMEKMLQEAGVDSAADKPTELMVRVQNASRISQQAGLKEQRRLELMRDCAKLPSWGQPLPLEFKDRITTGVSKEGFPVAKAASASLDDKMLCDVWRSWVISEQADLIAEEQREACSAKDDWQWIERTRQTAWRSQWESPAGKAAFGKLAQGRIETRYRMLKTLREGTNRSQMEKKSSPVNPLTIAP